MRSCVCCLGCKGSGLAAPRRLSGAPIRQRARRHRPAAGGGERAEVRAWLPDGGVAAVRRHAAQRPTPQLERPALAARSGSRRAGVDAGRAAPRCGQEHGGSDPSSPSGGGADQDHVAGLACTYGAGPAACSRRPRYPFWAYANHPKLGAELAAAAGCDPLAMTLIRRHQETGRGARGAAVGRGRGRGRSPELILDSALRRAAD